MTDRRLLIYHKTLASLVGEARSLADVTRDVSRVLHKEQADRPVSQVDVLVAASVLGRGTIKVIERADGVWLQRVGVV